MKLWIKKKVTQGQKSVNKPTKKNFFCLFHYWKSPWNPKNIHTLKEKDKEFFFFFLQSIRTKVIDKIYTLYHLSLLIQCFYSICFLFYFWENFGVFFFFGKLLVHFSTIWRKIRFKRWKSEFLEKWKKMAEKFDFFDFVDFDFFFTIHSSSSYLLQ